MTLPLAPLDLMPPPFADGLDDWSRGDGTPDSPTYELCDHARIAAGDADFGICLELRKVEPVQRLRYMAEMPLRPGSYLEIAARVKCLRGPLPRVRIAAFAGGAGGRGVIGLPAAAPEIALVAHDAVCVLAAVIGPEPREGVDLVWGPRALYAHVGLDLVGRDGGVVRIGRVEVRDVTHRFTPEGRVLAGFQPFRTA